METKVILMSIKPEYAEAIMSGRKTVEFRRRPLPTNIDLVLVYATAPVKGIVGSFYFEKQFEAAPHSLWAVYGDLGACTKEDFDRYFKGCETGTAIVITDAYRLSEPLNPRAVMGRKWVAPQSWYYISKLAGHIPAMVHVERPRPVDLPPPDGGKKEGQS